MRETRASSLGAAHGRNARVPHAGSRRSRQMTVRTCAAVECACTLSRVRLCSWFLSCTARKDDLTPPGPASNSRQDLLSSPDLRVFLLLRYLSIAVPATVSPPPPLYCIFSYADLLFSVCICVTISSYLAISARFVFKFLDFFFFLLLPHLISPIL